MEGRFILLLAALMVFVAPGVKGTRHLSYANNIVPNITREGCGVSKLCVEMPEDCDPVGTSNVCLFISVAGTPQATQGTDLHIQLRGNSDMIIALGLSADASEETTMFFACYAKAFGTLELNNIDNVFRSAERIVKEIRVSGANSVIWCEFEVPSVSQDTFSIIIRMGTLYTSILKTDPLNLLDPASNLPTATPTVNNTTPTVNNTTPTVNNTTTNSTTPSGATSLSHSHALPVLLTILMLFARV